MMVPVQRSFEEMGDPLSDVTFCVLDFETTGGDVNTCWITEIGVVKVRGGECLGTFQTLVNPGGAIPPTITMLTGISHQMVSRAPRIESVLPTLLEFLGDSVIVAHNLRFDLSFLQAALRRDGREPLHNRTLDTVALARRLLRDEVPNCKLGTLASHLRLPHQPSHRALEDALATADLLHLLIERAAGLGVAGFDDLVFLPTMAGHKYAQKLDLTARLPRSPGIYLFRNARNEVLYVGKATNLRSRVRSYFSTDERRKVGSLLAETARIDHKQTATVFEAEVLEIRLIHLLRPRFNADGTRWEKSVYVTLTQERYPRLKIVSEPPHNGGLCLGPIPRRSMASSMIEAVQSVIPIRRCTRPARRGSPCLSAQLKTALCPCSGEIDDHAYTEAVDRVRFALTVDPRALLEQLTATMTRLALEQRFEEAASVRDRSQALCSVLQRQRTLDQLRATECLILATDRGERFTLDRGRLREYCPPPPSGDSATLDSVGTVGRMVEALSADPGLPTDGPLAKELADELLVTSRWLRQHAASTRVEFCSGDWQSNAHFLPSIETADLVADRG